VYGVIKPRQTAKLGTFARRRHQIKNAIREWPMWFRVNAHA
jgi:hypothetical protein